MINDRDARPAWSFTLLHETVHLLLGQTGVSGAYGDSEVERFCNDVAGEFLLPARELKRLAFDDSRDSRTISERVSAVANEFKLSRTMVCYKAYRALLISRETFVQLSTAYRQEWREAREREDRPTHYVVRRHRLGGRIINLARRMMAADALSTSKISPSWMLIPRQNVTSYPFRWVQSADRPRSEEWPHESWGSSPGRFSPCSTSAVLSKRTIP